MLAFMAAAVVRGGGSVFMLALGRARHPCRCSGGVGCVLRVRVEGVVQVHVCQEVEHSGVARSGIHGVVIALKAPRRCRSGTLSRLSSTVNWLNTFTF
jgi:hypothetical protein